MAKTLSKLVLKDFYADWCGPCRMQTPIIQELEKEFKGKVSFEKINVDNNQALAGKYGVSGIPTIIIEKDGKIVKRFSELTEKEVLKKALMESMK
ncbi:Thioredoxin [Candidatus Tiddalikarchaeum anstoanum]|nr:Thioredoxin [Candidatus Tiddalikarchaeum anstoanum]